MSKRNLTSEARAAHEEKVRAITERAVLSKKGHVYAVRFTTGTAKVGKTVNPARRLRNHALSAQAHGIDIDRVWISEEHGGYSLTEQRLKDFCASLGTAMNSGGEHFGGISAEEFQGVCAFGFLATRERLRADYLRTLIDAVNGDMSKTWGEAQAALDTTAD
jgi:hypothetical protein